jgi:hypothetical protein
MNKYTIMGLIISAIAMCNVSVFASWRGNVAHLKPSIFMVLAD